jgi:hypothetical protein
LLAALSIQQPFLVWYSVNRSANAFERITVGLLALRWLASSSDPKPSVLGFIWAVADID